MKGSASTRVRERGSAAAWAAVWAGVVGTALIASISAPAGLAVNRPACHPDRLSEQSVNLDRDAAKEQVEAADLHDCAHTHFEAYVRIRDRCHGTWRTFDLDSDGEILQQFRIANADGRTKRPEVFFMTYRRGPVMRGIAEVVRLDGRPPACAHARALFRYVPAAAVQTFNVELKDLTRKFPGLEVVVTEGREVAQTVTTYRYDRALDRYVKYS
jgi:hypothetical protein